MQRLSPPRRVEWLNITIRWIVLTGLASWLVFQQAGTPAVGAVLLAAAAWNLILTFLANQELLIGGSEMMHRVTVIALDLIIANLLFYLAGASGQTLLWAGLLPVVSGAVYFEPRGLALVVMVSLLSVGSQFLITAPPMTALRGVGLFAVIYGLAAFLILSLRRHVLAAAQKSAREQANLRQDKVEAERQRGLFDLIAALTATLDHQRVLDNALDTSTSALASASPSDERIVSAVLLFSQNDEAGAHLTVASARRFTAADQRIELPAKTGLLAHAIESGEGSLTNHPANDEELSRIVALRSCRSAYCVPLQNGRESYGAMLFAHSDDSYFNDERREMLDIIGHQAMIALQNARRYEELEDEKERIIELQEEARNQLARDLHDGPTQSVAALAMRINFARRLMERDASLLAEELAKIEELARRTVQELRHMLFTLRPLVLESQGLPAALQSMAEKMRESYRQDVLISVDEQALGQLEMGKQNVLFFMAEEAVNNARKHARAEHIWVQVQRLGDDLVLLEVRDDGAGFDLRQVDADHERPGSPGLAKMRGQAELVKGALKLDSTPGHGTSVQVVIPLTEEAAARIHGRK